LWAATAQGQSRQVDAPHRQRQKAGELTAVEVALGNTGGDAPSGQCAGNCNAGTAPPAQSGFGRVGRVERTRQPTKQLTIPSLRSTRYSET
jgi:hypothetical protein